MPLPAPLILKTTTIPKAHRNFTSEPLTWAWEQMRDAPWAEWKTFWLQQVFSAHFVVIYALPLTLVLLLVARRRLRLAIVIAGMAFLTYLLGALYAFLWLLTALAFHGLGERYEAWIRRPGASRWGPPVLLIVIVTGWYLISQAVDEIDLPAQVNAWLRMCLPFLFPLGARGLAWEPAFSTSPPTQLLGAIFFDAHFIGTAYLAMKLLHYYSEIHRGGIPAELRSRLNFLAWVCYAPGLIQGPIERFPRFVEEIESCHLRRSWWNVPPALGRMGLGVVKSIVVVRWIEPVMYWHLGLGWDSPHHYYLRPEGIREDWLFYLALFLPITHLYLMFSGYVDVSAGMARLLGYRQVENFERPYFATSLRIFWRRWHISLSMLLRDYLYIPFGGNRRHVLLNLCATFAICGFWHRPNAYAVGWGVLMGVLLWLNQYWSHWNEWLAQHPELFWARVQRAWLRLRPLPQIVSWVITAHVFCWSLLLLFGGSGIIHVTAEMARRLGGWVTGGL